MWWDLSVQKFVDLKTPQVPDAALCVTLCENNWGHPNFLMVAECYEYDARPQSRCKMSMFWNQARRNPMRKYYILQTVIRNFLQRVLVVLGSLQSRQTRHFRDEPKKEVYYGMMIYLVIMPFSLANPQAAWQLLVQLWHRLKCGTDFV